MRKITLHKDDVHHGDLILVNHKHAIKNEILAKTIRLVPFGNPEKGILLERRAATLLAQLVQSVGCEEDIVPVSGYRSRSEQEKLFHDSLRDNGRTFTEQYVAYPDCSEHQTGLAIDLGENQSEIDFIRPSLPYTGVFAQFREMAIRHGFIERYQCGKEDITGISHEPWHFRYVGYPHAFIMQQHRFCLEEYIQFLRDFPMGQHYTFTSEQNFAVFYVPAIENNTIIELPDSGWYQISGNNVDGFIITIWGARG